MHDRRRTQRRWARSPWAKSQQARGHAKKKKGAGPKKPTRGIRVAAHLPPHDPVADYNQINASWTAIKNDATHFPNPPFGAEVDQEVAALGTAIQNAQGGDPAAVAEMHVAADKLKTTWSQVVKWVEGKLRAGAWEETPAILANILMYASKVGQRKPKDDITVAPLPAPGSALVTLKRIANAVHYVLESSADGQTFAFAAESAKTKVTLAGLPVGKLLYLRYKAFVRGDNVWTAYSVVVTFMLK
jgi:hypothetical protein